MGTALESQTYMPGEDAALAALADLLADPASGEFALVGPSGRVVITRQIHQILEQVINAMKAGKAVTVTPESQQLTTQQAADLLGMSRPTFVKLLESGQLPYERTTHRRMVALEDVLAYRRQRKERQLAALAAIAADLDDEPGGVDVNELLAQARAAAAQRRGSRRRA